MDDEIQEEWSDIPGYEGKYQVSNLGRVKSLKGKKERILKPQKTTAYDTVNLCMEGKYRTAYVHQLVAHAFVPNPSNPRYVKFKVSSWDCRASNLRWAKSLMEETDYEEYMRRHREANAISYANIKVLTSNIQELKKQSMLEKEASKKQEKLERAEARRQQKLDKEAAKEAEKKKKLRLAESAKQIRLELARKRGKLK